MPLYPPTSESHLSPLTPIISSLVSPLPTPTYGPSGSFSILSKTLIPGISPPKCLSLIRDTATWPQWNTFCPGCEILPTSPAAPDSTDENIPTGWPTWLEMGTRARIDVSMSGEGLKEGYKRGRTTGIEVSVLRALEKEKGEREGYVIAWKGVGYPQWQLWSERVLEFRKYVDEDGREGTEFVCWETFGGLIAMVVKYAVGSQLVDRFGDYSRDLRGAFEGGKVDGGSLVWKVK